MVETVDEMPTECERSDVTLCGQQQQQQQGEVEPEQRLTQQAQQNNQQQLMQHKINTVEKTIESESYTMEDVKELATNGEMSTSQTSTTSTTSSTNENGTSNGGSKRASIISPDPTAYVTKARVTRPTPPPPSYNPMQFVQIKPSHLYQTAQQQLKKAEEVKKIKEIKKEEPEDWQNNLDNWKSSRRKRVEHIIDRVVEVKKLELEEHDRSRRKSKTFSEMIEERSERGARGRTKLASLAVYNEDESNDLSDLGIGTSSASGKSSLSEDYDNNSVMSDNVTELDKAVLLNKNAQQQIQQNNCKINNNHLISNNNNNNRGYVSSPGYDTSSSTAPASSPDPCEYTYEGAIQDYKQRVSRAASSGIGNGYKLKTSASKESTPERQTIAPVYPTRRGSKIEDRLIGFEVSSPSDSQECVEKQKVVVPKIDISKRKEVFEQTLHTNEPKSSVTTNGIPKVTLRERFNAPTAKIAETNSKQDLKRMSGDMTSIRDRLQNLEQQKSGTSAMSNGNNNKLGDITVPPLKERLSCLHSAAAKEDVKKKPVQLVDDRQLEIMKTEDENAKQRYKAQLASNNLIADIETELGNTLEQLSTAANSAAKAEEAQLNAAIAALEVEEQKLEAAANAVNKIEAEFAELSDEALLNTTVGTTTTTTATTNEMEFSINEALELALQEIDNEPNCKNMNKNNTANINNLPACSKKNNNTFNQPNELKTQITNKNKINKTDEEKELKAQEENLKEKKQEEEDQLCVDDNGKNGDDEELRISKEPIYENVSTTSINQVDVANNNNNKNKITRTTAIIPLKQQRENNNVENKKNIKNNTTATNLKINDNNKNLITDTNETNNNNNNEKINSYTKINKTTTSSKNDFLTKTKQPQQQTNNTDPEAYYQVPKSIVSEPYYDAPKNLRPVPVYENIDVFYTGLDTTLMSGHLEPPKEKPPPPPIESPPPLDDTRSMDNGENWSLDNTYETITNQRTLLANVDHPSPPIKRMNSTKRIKKELRNKRSSFLGIAPDDDDDAYLELTVAPPPDMTQLLQEERRLEKQLYLKAAGMCDSSDTGESRDSGVSENHSRQSSEHYTNSSEENDHARHLDSPTTYQTEAMKAAQTPLLQTVQGDCAEAWTESATVAAAAATQCLTEATATANAKMLSIEEKIREQEEVLRVERELLQLEQEELKRQRENLMLRENMARRELQHGAKMLMSANRHSLQDLNHSNPVQPIAVAPTNPDVIKSPLRQQQIYANLPNNNKRLTTTTTTTTDSFCQPLRTDYRKSMSDINEFTKRSLLPPIPPTKPLRAMQVVNNIGQLPNYGGSLIKIATPTAAPRGTQIYANYASHYQSVQNLPQMSKTTNGNGNGNGVGLQYGNMSRNTLLALSATPKPKYTDGWVQVQSAAALQQKRKSLPESAFNNTANNYSNHWLVQEAEQRRISAEERRASLGNKLSNGNVKNKPLPDSIIQTLTERVQSKGLGERKRLDQMNSSNLSPLHTAGYQQQLLQKQKHTTTKTLNLYNEKCTPTSSPTKTPNGSAKTSTTPPEKILSVSGKKKCSHCGDELGRGAAMTIESLLLFYHINCFKCCVCHVQLGDGLNGTDVRVRNNKLHCQNCYSSDDGIKFSCV